MTDMHILFVLPVPEDPFDRSRVLDTLRDHYEALKERVVAEGGTLSITTPLPAVAKEVKTRKPRAPKAAPIGLVADASAPAPAPFDAGVDNPGTVETPAQTGKGKHKHAA